MNNTVNKNTQGKNSFIKESSPSRLNTTLPNANNKTSSFFHSSARGNMKMNIVQEIAETEVSQVLPSSVNSSQKTSNNIK
jgi:hypothetical protein